MRKNSTFMFSATVISLALILPCPADAQTMSVPQTTTTQPKTTTTSPTLIQQPPSVLRPQVGNALISVRDNSGLPVGAATVSMTGNGQTVTQLTSAQGQTSFGNLGVGQYSYTVRKDGYCSQSANIPLDISMGSTATSDSVLTRYGSANVKVTYNGIPVRDVDVTARIDVSLFTSAKTDANGSATFILPPSTFRFSASKVGYDHNQVDRNIPCGQVTIVPMAIKDLPIHRPGTTRVMVKDPYLGALAGAIVSVTVGGIPLNQTTNAYGYADLNGLPKGKFVFSASKDGYLTNKVDADAAPPEWATYVYITLTSR